eukprot:scaffold226889_cov48-Prasinocladus_malaysianus.AAC.1
MQGNEKVFEFLETVFSEVIDIFPFEYIHIGGDEVRSLFLLYKQDVIVHGYNDRISVVCIRRCRKCNGSNVQSARIECVRWSPFSSHDKLQAVACYGISKRDQGRDSRSKDGTRCHHDPHKPLLLRLQAVVK